MSPQRDVQEFSADNLELAHGESQPGPRLPNAEEVQLLDTALSSILDFAYIFDRDGRFIYANQPLLNLWGLKLEDAVGKNFFDLEYPEDLAAKLQRQIQQVIETRQGLTDETPYTSPAGVTGFYEYIFRPVLEPDGAVSMVAGSTRDISERKRAEEDLHRTQARLESALKAGLAGTFYWDITKDRITTDENMKRYFSLSEQSLGEGVALAQVLRAIHDDDRVKVEQALTEAIQRTGSYSIEYRIQHSDGRMRWLSARGLIERDQEGKAIGLPGFTIDITERKSAEEAIRFQAHLLNTVEQAVIATNLDGTITYWNKFAEQLYGWSSVEVIGRNIIEAVSSAATLEQAAEIMDYLREGKSWSGEFMVRRRDGTTFPVMITNTPIHDDEERLVGIVGVSTNIAERKLTMSLLDAQKQSLEMVVGGAPLAEILTFLTRVVEQQAGGQAVAAILSMDENGCLYHAAAPSLPEDYIRAIDGIKADENVGTCSAAAACGKVVISPDIATDPNWKGLSHLPLGLGFKAACSIPIIAKNGRVLGTFGTYFRERREPTQLEHQMLEILARTAALAIERARVEDALRESEQRLRAIFEASRDGILVEDDERIIYINKAYTQLLGYDSPEELIDEHISAVISPEDANRLLEFGRSRAQGQPRASVYEFKGKRKDGKLVDVEASVSTSTVAGRRYITTMVRDIVERKLAERALRESHEELERRVGERTVALSKMNVILQEEVRERRRIESERVELLRRIVFAQEDERRRIAREMHDQLGQQLTVLKLKLDAFKEGCGENGKLSEQVEALQTLAGQLDADVDHMVWEMRPTALDDLGLQAALSSYVQNWAQNLGIPVQLHASGMDERLTPEIETALYRIAQEALNNIAKHAHAAQVAIVLERRADQVSLIIEDDGVGFDLQQVLSPDDIGFGLVGLRERAALFGGTVEIESQPNEGATVVVRIPIPPAPDTGETNE